MLSLYNPYHSNELFQQEIISAFEFYYKLDKTQAVTTIINQLPEFKRESLKKIKRKSSEELKIFNKRFTKINLFRRIAGKEPYGISNTPESTINDDGTGYISTGVEGQPSLAFVNVATERLVLKLLVFHHVKKRYKDFLEQKKVKDQDKLINNLISPGEEVASTLQWLGKDGTELTHFAYALYNSGRATNNTGEVTKFVEEFARVFNFKLSKHWQSNRSKSINNTGKVIDLTILDDLLKAHHEQINQLIKDRETKKFSIQVASKLDICFDLIIVFCAVNFNTAHERTYHSAGISSQTADPRRNSKCTSTSRAIWNLTSAT